MLKDRTIKEINFLNDFQGLERIQDNSMDDRIEEKQSICPKCNQELKIFIEQNFVTCFCEHCYFSQAVKY